MSDEQIHSDTLRRLRRRAEQAGISVDAMLNQLLDEGARLLVPNISDLVTVHTPEGYYRYVTPSVHPILGYTVDDLIGRKGANFVHPDDMPTFRQAYKEVMTTGYSRFEYRVRHKDGHYVWFDTVCHLVRHMQTGGASEIIAVSHDISERKHAEQIINQREEYYRLLFQESPVAIWKQDFSGMKSYLDGILQQGITDIEAYLSDTPQAVDECLRRVRVLDANSSALRMYGVDTVDEANARFAQLIDHQDPQQPPSLAAIARGELRFSGEFINRSVNGENIYLLLKWLVLPGHEATYAEVLVVTVDITEQKRYQASLIENELMTSQFRREQEHNRLLQHSVSALAHDLRTPLTVINNSKELLLNYFDRLSEEKRKEKLETIGKQLQFAIQLIDDTVNKVRGSLNERVFKPSMVNIGKLCAVSVEEMGINQRHRLIFRNPKHIDVAWVDDILVSRILMNLLSNAIKYSPADKPIILELDHDQTHLILRVTDNGIGIAPEHLPRIFEPFFRVYDTNTIGGAGLGLSIVKECVETHGGTIEVESTIGIGTSFTVKLPYVDMAMVVGG
jgi:PAS domain S-box-containing protein